MQNQLEAVSTGASLLGILMPSHCIEGVALLFPCEIRKWPFVLMRTGTYLAAALARDAISFMYTQYFKKLSYGETASSLLVYYT